MRHDPFCKEHWIIILEILPTNLETFEIKCRQIQNEHIQQNYFTLKWLQANLLSQDTYHFSAKGSWVNCYLHHGTVSSIKYCEQRGLIDRIHERGTFGHLEAEAAGRDAYAHSAHHDRLTDNKRDCTADRTQSIIPSTCARLQHVFLWFNIHICRRASWYTTAGWTTVVTAATKTGTPPILHLLWQPGRAPSTRQLNEL